MIPVLAGEDWLLHPAAEPDHDTVLARFLDATGEGRLELPSCSACDEPLDFDQVRCDACAVGGPEWRVRQPVARVLASTLMHRVDPRYVKDPGPYALVEVELDSGHRLVLGTAAPARRAPEPGSEVSLVLVRVGRYHVPRVSAPEEREGHE